MALPIEPFKWWSTPTEIFSGFCKCRKEAEAEPWIDIKLSGSTLWPCGDHFYGTVSTYSFSKLLAIAEHLQYFLPYHSPITINNDPWSVPCSYHYSHRLVHPYKQGIPQSHPDTKRFSPTEMPHVRHGQGVIGIKYQQVCHTRSVREIQIIWHCWNPFCNHHPHSWFIVPKVFLYPLKIISWNNNFIYNLMLAV